jgi:glycosyltransferase involved in cell wall biosynthesis
MDGGGSKRSILLLSRYAAVGPSSRVRFYQYLPYLRAHGFEVAVEPLLDGGYMADLYAHRPMRTGSVLRGYRRRLRTLIGQRKFGLLWIEGELWPFLPAWGEMALSALKAPTVVDYDDSIFHRYDQHPRWIVRRLLGGKINTVMRRAGAVTVGNRYLAARAQSAGARRVISLPSVVDLDRYQVAPPHPDGVFTIGWIGSPTSVRHLAIIAPALAALCANGRARLVLVGSGPVRLPGVDPEIVEWSEDTEVAHLREFDVGIMPLSDDPITRGKSGYKLVQYLACGLPAVASPVGANRDIIQDGVSGLLAGTVSEWVQVIDRLRSDQELRRRIGAAGRKRVETEYALRVTAPRLADLFCQFFAAGGER